MPARTLLSAAQRTRLFSIPTDTAAMARHYVLDAADLAIVEVRRRASNRLGFAVQLCVLRDPGRVLDPTEVPPEPMLAFVARQIDADPALFGEYARRAETRREHLLEHQRFLRLRSFGLDDWRACLRIGTDAAWATDRGEPIVSDARPSPREQHPSVIGLRLAQGLIEPRARYCLVQAPVRLCAPFEPTNICRGGISWQRTPVVGDTKGGRLWIVILPDHRGKRPISVLLKVEWDKAHSYKAFRDVDCDAPL